jgi:hypothetical protein
MGIVAGPGVPRVSALAAGPVLPGSGHLSDCFDLPACFLQGQFEFVPGLQQPAQLELDALKAVLRSLAALPRQLECLPALVQLGLLHLGQPPQSLVLLLRLAQLGLQCRPFFSQQTRLPVLGLQHCHVVRLCLSE